MQTPLSQATGTGKNSTSNTANIHKVASSENVSIIPPTKKPITEKEYSFEGEGLSRETPPSVRVAAYCRVSTEDDHQLNSYTAQIEHYTNYIRSHADWICIGIFADEGLSGTQTTHRHEFNRLMQLCRLRQIDIILCKSISRFARNTVDCLTYIRELKLLGIAVIFEKENLNTLSLSTEFIISLHASFAQAESESISRNITWGIEKSFRAGRFPLHFSRMMGYCIDADKSPKIIEEEADHIRDIYALFISGKSMGEIAKIMTTQHVTRRCGSSSWSRKNVEKILRNEKYAGFAILQKTYTTDCLTHERTVNLGERPKYIVHDCLPALIDMNTYEKVQLEFQRRSSIRKNATPTTDYSGDLSSSIEVPIHIKRNRPTYLLNQFLTCPYCDAHYRRVIWKSGNRRYAVWRCATRLENSAGFCPKSVSIHENILIKCLNEHLSPDKSPGSATVGDFSSVIRYSADSFSEITFNKHSLEQFNNIQKIEVRNKHLLNVLFKDDQKTEILLC